MLSKIKTQYLVGVKQSEQPPEILWKQLEFPSAIGLVGTKLRRFCLILSMSKVIR